MNTFFKKKPQRKWTWLSPDGKTKNEIDYILTTLKHSILDTTTLNVSFGSDHRLVRAKLYLRSRQSQTSNKRKTNNRIDPTLLKTDPVVLENYTRIFQQKRNIYQTQGQSSNELAEKLSSLVSTAAKETLTRPIIRAPKISTPTKQLIAQRKTIQADPLTTVHYRNLLNKQIRKAVRKDVYEHKKEVVMNPIETHRGPKVFRKATKWKSETMMMAIKDTNGTIQTGKNEIVETTRIFYQTLYDSQTPYIEDTNDKRATLTRHLTEDLPEINRDELIYAISQMKANKASGPDNIPMDILKYTNDLHIQDTLFLFNNIPQWTNPRQVEKLQRNPDI